MRSIAFSILLLFSTQAFGMLRQITQFGALLSKNVTKKNIPKFVLQKRKFSSDKKYSPQTLAGVFITGSLFGALGGYGSACIVVGSNCEDLLNSQDEYQRGLRNRIKELEQKSVE